MCARLAKTAKKAPCRRNPVARGGQWSRVVKPKKGQGSYGSQGGATRRREPAPGQVHNNHLANQGETSSNAGCGRHQR
jgi:hypothetical protein